MPPALGDTADRPQPGECWCCGQVDRPDRMIGLGNHPEVLLCLECARWAAKQAGAIDDRDGSGPLVVARARLRDLRQAVVHRGWHRNRVVGGALRWLGKYLP